MLRDGAEVPVENPKQVAEACKEIREAAQEHMLCLDLNGAGKLVDKRLITLGIADATLVHSREVFRGAIANGATAIVLVHNHPSGDPTPSAEDLKLTQEILEAGKILRIPLRDHVIVAAEGQTSLREEGAI